MPGLPVILLAGGRGSRAYPDTEELPKPLLTVGGRPVVEHVMGIYARQGHTHFVVAAGYRADVVLERYRRGRVDGLAGAGGPVTVEVVDHGPDTETGDRLRLAAATTEGPRILATYADGLADIDLAALEAAHARAHNSYGAGLTVTTVRLPSPYGTVETTAEGRVVRFREKPRLDDHWINAGFFVLEREVFDGWSGRVLETEVLPALAGSGRLNAFRHDGFWKSLDTFKDRLELEALAAESPAPWERGPSA